MYAALAQQPPSAPHQLKPKPKPKPKSASTATPKEQKKRAGLKDKAKVSASARRREGGERDGPVLGGADYVELMFGGRRKAAAEAAKLPQDPDSL